MFKIISHQGNSNQNHTDTTLRQLEWKKLTRQETTIVGEDVEKGDPSYIVDGNASWYSHSLKTVWRSLKKLKIELPFDPDIALLGVYPKDTDVVKRRAICTTMFIAALCTIAKWWTEPRCPSTDACIKKMWSIYTMEYYLAIKKNDFSTFAATWMDWRRLC